MRPRPSYDTTLPVFMKQAGRTVTDCTQLKIGVQNVILQEYRVVCERTAGVHEVSRPSR